MWTDQVPTLKKKRLKALHLAPHSSNF